MLRYSIGFAALMAIFLLSCNSNSDYYFPGDGAEGIDLALRQALEAEGGMATFTFPDSEDLESIPQDPNNPLTRTKVGLGKLLFHETALASESSFPESINTYSCASCHHAAAGFQANVAQGIGDGGIGFGSAGEGRITNPICPPEDIDVQPIRTPSALNIAYQTNILWNGQFGATAINEGTEDLWTEDTPLAVNKLGFEGVETQAIAGLDVHRFGLTIDETFIKETDYKELFDIAFAETDENERYSLLNAGLAIAAYERTLLANQSPFQKWLKGEETAMTDNQKRGAILFMEKNCTTCHSGPALSSMEFHAYGMADLSDHPSAINVKPDDSANLGRGGFTKNVMDNYKFKVPQLYNLKDSPLLGHGSSFSSVREVLEYKNEAISQNNRVDNSSLSTHFTPLNLDPMEISQLEDFIENALYDPQLFRYVPDALPSGNCFPNNDALSKIDLGCI